MKNRFGEGEPPTKRFHLLSGKAGIFSVTRFPLYFLKWSNCGQKGFSRAFGGRLFHHLRTNSKPKQNVYTPQKASVLAILCKKIDIHSLYNEWMSMVRWKGLEPPTFWFVVCKGRFRVVD
jgi:hypothetical protein